MRPRLVTFLSTLALSLTAAVALSPASAAPEDGDGGNAGRYVALGDSYAAGTGTATVVSTCLQSTTAYPVQLATSEGYLPGSFDFWACAGATPADVAGFLYANPMAENTEAVTLTIGGNDELWSVNGIPLGWTDVLQACLYADGGLLGAPGCRNVITSGPDMPGLSDRITGLVSLINAQAPDAEILVSGYPQLFGNFPTPTCTVGAATATYMGAPLPGTTGILVAKQDARWINQQTTGLNNAIRVGVNQANSAGLPVTFVDVAPAFNGHGLCDRQDAWVNGALGVTVEIASSPASVTSVFPQSFHLNISGDTAYAERFLARGFGG